MWNTQVFTRTGKAKMREQWGLFWQGFEKVVFLGNVFSIEGGGDTAKTRAIQRVEILLKGGGICRLAELYSDLIVCRNGQWLFDRRDFSVLVEEVPG